MLPERRRRKVWSVDWSPCGNKLSAACNNFDDDSFSVQIFCKEGSTGNFVCQSTLSGHSDDVFSAAWSPDGTKLASGSKDKTVKIWNPATGECLWMVRGHTDYVNTQTRSSACASFRMVPKWSAAMTGLSCISCHWEAGQTDARSSTSVAVSGASHSLSQPKR